MINKIKTIFVQTILISFGIVFAMTFEGIFYHFIGDDIVFSWYHLFSIIFVSFISSIPGLLFDGMDKMSKKEFIIRLICHCALIFLITMVLGYLFHWYSSFLGFMLITISYFIIYAFVWFGISLLGRQDANQINTALDSIRDTE